MSDPSNKTGPANRREVPVVWEALEDAFENNAPEVHSYLHIETGEVIRVVDGIADPSMHSRIMSNPQYLPIDPVSSREQYRWMERFIETVEHAELRTKLSTAIDGKGAFRRFKDVLMAHAVDRERWFAFRSERLRATMETWLVANNITAVERPEWRVPSADEVQTRTTEERPGRRSRADVADAQRRRLHELVDLLPARELDTALAFLDFLRERRHMSRPRARTVHRTATTSDAPETNDAEETSAQED